MSSPKLVATTIAVSKQVMVFKLTHGGEPSIQEPFLAALRAELNRRKIKIDKGTP